jgi:hypothetical protein
MTAVLTPGVLSAKVGVAPLNCPSAGAGRTGRPR